MGVRLGNGNWGVKANKLLAYNDASGVFFNKEFDFTRATTATRVNKSGLIESVATNVPRIDFTDDTKGYLLLEPAATNLITHSENLEISSASGTSRQNNATTTASSLPSPDGGTNAFTFIYDGTHNASVKKVTAASADQVITFSVFIKKTSETNFSGDTKCQIGIFNNVVSVQTTPLGNALNAATIGEWVRYSVTATVDSDGGNVIPNLRCDEAASFDVFGWQLEANSFATSYIPTSGSTVTRNAETCDSSGAAQDFNSTEGVLYCEIEALEDSTTGREIQISDGSANNRVSIFLGGASNRIRTQVQIGGSEAFNKFTTTYDVKNFNKIAVRYKASNYAFYINGALIGQSLTQTSIFSANTLNQLNLVRIAVGNRFYGKIREVRAYTTGLTDAELIALTT
mgnify:CR=1 FL=1